jgi:hypothetical protein
MQALKEKKYDEEDLRKIRLIQGLQRRKLRRQVEASEEDVKKVATYADVC